MQSGEVAERFKAAVLKTVDCNRSGGSNPSLSAKHRRVPNGGLVLPRIACPKDSFFPTASVAKLVDARDLKSLAFTGVPVRFRPEAPLPARIPVLRLEQATPAVKIGMRLGFGSIRHSAKAPPQPVTADQRPCEAVSPWDRRHLAMPSFILALSIIPWHSALALEDSGIHAPQARFPVTANQESVPLAEALERLKDKQGHISYTLAPELSKDRVTIDNAVNTHQDGIGWLLRGYNWMGTYDTRGRLTAVNVTGRNGDGIGPADFRSKPLALLSYRKSSMKLPRRFRSLPAGSVYPVDIPIEKLRNMTKGERVSLKLPGAEYTLRHDNAWRHDNGDKTWVAQLETSGNDLYRSQITLGEGEYLDGQIRTPGGLYLLEADDSGTWLIDLAASGMRRGEFDTGGIFPPGIKLAPQAGPSLSRQGSASDEADAEEPDFASGRTGAVETTVIDVLLLHSRNMAGPGSKTRMNHLMALANQALVDSRAPVRLRLAGIEASQEMASGGNRQTLYRLTANQGVYRNAGLLRKKHRADLVLLVRGFKAKVHGGSCGEAWVNGSSGAPFSPDLAYGVVNQGRDGGYYCSGHTLAHEIGHLLGATHDRRHSRVPGHFSYAHGYGVPGKFGDIMSYIDPETGLFANPAIPRCSGLPCGIEIGTPGEADVVSTFGKTAKTVASFLSGAEE